ncbi:MAG: hypothetical protein V7K38_23150 [Nostoc sp.]
MRNLGIADRANHIDLAKGEYGKYADRLYFSGRTKCPMPHVRVLQVKKCPIVIANGDKAE